MKKNKKLFFFLFLFLVLLVGSGIFFVVFTSGEIFEQDGLLQNSRIRIEKISVQNQTLYYTLSNKTCHGIKYEESPPLLQRKINGEWLFLPPREDDLGNNTPSILFSLNAFSSFDASTSLSDDRIDTGEYRFFYCYYDGEDRLYAVGYFTIPEY